MPAMTATTLDQLPRPCITLRGPRVSGPQVVEGWHGVPYGKTAGANARVRRDRAPDLGAPAAARTPRRALSDSIPRRRRDRLGKPLKSILHGRKIPIYLDVDRAEECRAGGGDRGRLDADLVLAVSHAGLPRRADRRLQQGRQRQGAAQFSTSPRR